MTTDINSATRQRRMARPKQDAATVSAPVAPPAPTAKAPSKLDQLEALLCSDGGASIADMMAATGWQQHSVRGAMAGVLKKRGLVITSGKTDGLRRYRAVRV